MTPEDAALQARIDAAVQAPDDRSAAYTQQIAALKQAIAQGLQTSVRLDSDMNYNASQALCFTWQLDGRYLEMDLRVSSRGKLYFVQARDVVFKGVDVRPMGERGDPDLLLPTALRPHMAQLQIVLQAHGLWRLPNARKQQPAPGCLTRLGDEPATLFEVLFAEIE